MGSLEGCRHNKRRFYISYVLSTMIGGAMTGVSVALLGQLLELFMSDDSKRIVLIVALLIFLLLEIFKRTKFLPSGNFAIPAEWINKGGNDAAALWGVLLGIGVITYQAGSLFHAYITALFLSEEWWHGLLAGLLFGFVRSVVPLTHKARNLIIQMADTRRKTGTLLNFVRWTFSMTTLTLSLTWIILVST